MLHYADFLLSESRISVSEKYVKFHEDAEDIHKEFEILESLLKSATSEDDMKPIEEKWQDIGNMFSKLETSGQDFITGLKEVRNYTLYIERIKNFNLNSHLKCNDYM